MEEKHRHHKKFRPYNRPHQNRPPLHQNHQDKKEHAEGAVHPHHQESRGKMRIIPLGGLEEVGKNIMAIEYENDIVIIDCGMSFAGPEMLGVDYIVPDVTYLAQRKQKIRGIIFTHGHLDHIGAIQYALPKLGNPPIYATKLTAGLMMNRLQEFGLDKSAKINLYNENSKLKLGQFEIEFFRVNHSIPEGMGVYVKSPAGSAIHTGDFKFDYQPAIDKPADLQRIAELGKRGVDVLMADSTNALKPGFCKSEREIANQLERVIAHTKGRLIVTSFSSLIGRIDQICNIASKFNRKVFLAGRSIIENMQLAEKLGYTTYPKGSVRKIGPQVNSLPPSQVIILTTGAQGEAMSALTRMALGEHAQIKIREGDTVVISASPIPGNELAIVNVINNLYAQGAKVITNGEMDVHTSGHAHQEELKMMYSLVKPRSYIPIHGELFMRIGHGDFIKEIGDPNLHVTILENGDVLEINSQGVRKSKEKIPANDILVDGLGFGDIGSKVLQERKTMSQDGMLLILFRAYEESKRLVGEPDIISRGFVYVKESQAIASETKQVARKAFENITGQNRKIELKDLKQEIGRNVSGFIRKRLGREPMILPIIMYI
ncbi:MAG: ribonuclease J [Candidatus Peregrinibacteria bacterium]